MTELVKQQPPKTYKFIQTVPKMIGDELIKEGGKEGLTLQGMIRIVLREWYRRNNHGS